MILWFYELTQPLGKRQTGYVDYEKAPWKKLMFSGPQVSLF